MQVAEENPSGEPAAFGCLKPLRYCLIWIALYELTLGLAAEIVSDYLLEPQSRDGYAALMALGGFAFLSSSLESGNDGGSFGRSRLPSLSGLPLHPRCSRNMRPGVGHPSKLRSLDHRLLDGDQPANFMMQLPVCASSGLRASAAARRTARSGSYR
jgi:hypothetical protein